MAQGSESWHLIKLGHASASHFSTVIGKAGSTRSLYMRKLIAEILTGEPQESYSNGNMERGLELEPLAREYYESMNGCVVKQVGFIEVSENIGVSPDGLVGEDGYLEIKAPLPSTHIDYILKDREVASYKAQCQGGLWATGRKWVDFVSYCPEITSRPYWAIRVTRDEKYIAEIDIKVNKFVAEMKQLITKISGPKF
jgi:hypothetical protein